MVSVTFFFEVVFSLAFSFDFDFDFQRKKNESALLDNINRGSGEW